MKAVDEARKRWDSLFNANSSLAELKQSSRNKDGSNPCEDGLRSVGNLNSGQAFLLHQTVDTSSWPGKISDSRAAYLSLREHFLKYINHPNDLPSTADPLAEDDESPWQSLRRDEAIRAEIHQDVERCMQENYFFREPTTKARMLDILFVYTKLNPDLGYRQGMHELLAPILWVLEHDAINKELIQTTTPPADDGDIMLQVLDSDYVEHDAFTIFCAIMQTAKLFYEQEPKRFPGGQSDVSPIVARSRYIHQVVLRVVDLELANHLQSTDILPQIFLTRWIRLLFGREFPFKEVLSIWDMLFAENMRIELIDAICVAMLLRIRWQLLDADYSSSLRLLLQYPSPMPYKPITFVEDALFLEQNQDCEGATLLIQKYSGKTPDPNKQWKPRSSLTVPLFTPRRKKSTSRERGPVSSGSTSPSVSSVRIHQRRLDSLFQDVSEGLHRRTEGWGVTNAVRGAMVEARRNIQSIQSSASTPQLLQTESSSRESTDSPPMNFATERELNDRISALEIRNQALARMLGNAINELRIQQEDPSKSTTEAMDLALAKIQFVQVYLEDPTIPIPEETKPTTWAAVSAHSSEPVLGEHVKVATTALAKKESNPPNGEQRPEKKSPLHPFTETRVSEVENMSKPVSFRSPPTMRAPLSESSFSWMLGDDKLRSGLITSVLPPPEQNRNSATLFGDARGDGKKNVTGDEEEGVLLNRLRRGPEKPR
ncbi:uncharacterized protein PADG_01450 [Paracoccidioides brasiliensis Pb18]|uniref:Rab-GAP TBC domain-containing protein n=1 Tax=Paracoccidioides brasiliensis (strain Pb18) TaxID=502780 RepID=C1G3D4_PARBD|nr:uncharacterized protein PADG_01450 [Paracoccidioides brasiliensis Pb18]EEH45300.1 hypothetical protein PADG_01450 [Paracoccidioides brasiliensis Pb18]